VLVELTGDNTLLLLHSPIRQCKVAAIVV